MVIKRVEKEGKKMNCFYILAHFSPFGLGNPVQKHQGLPL
jgi:hypothetical protein